MAINQILAPYFIKMKYQTYAAVHSMRAYFETGSTLISPTVLAPGEWGIQGVAAASPVAISTIAFEMFNRVNAALPLNTKLLDIEVWQSAEGANVFIGQNALPADVDYGVGTGVAAAYDMLVMGSATRQKFRLTYFDTKNPAPQRSAGGNVPVVDNGSINWYLLKSLVPFATQDGHRLTSIRSFNTGYNRKLARSYGRIISP